MEGETVQGMGTGLENMLELSPKENRSLTAKIEISSNVKVVVDTFAADVRVKEVVEGMEHRVRSSEQHVLLIDKGIEVGSGPLAHAADVGMVDAMQGSSPAEACAETDLKVNNKDITVQSENYINKHTEVTSDSEQMKFQEGAAGTDTKEDKGHSKRKREADDTPEISNMISGELSQASEDNCSKTLEAVEDTKETSHVTENGAGGPPRRPRYKKRKVAMFVSYCGFGYQGMQRNRGAKTIEGDLEEALFKAGAIAESTFGDPRKIDWTRAARTDKGVSAVGQVVSGRFFVDPPGFVERVNSYLPKQIRVLGFKRVTGSFSAKNLCDRRRYEYVLPLFCLDSASHRNESPCTVQTSVLKESKPEDSAEVCPVECANSELQGARQSGSDSALVVEEKSAVSCTCKSSDSGFIFGDEERRKLNGILQHYTGTHNFHNFTCRIKPEDPSTQRYILSFEASDVFTIESKKFVRCTVVGQSFMLHQIRKMIGLAVAVMRGCASESIFETAFRRDVKLNVPLAPELGLFLDECMFPAYNQRFSSTHEEISLKDFEEEIAEFKAGVIYPHVASTEAKEGVFARWIHILTEDRYPDFAADKEHTSKSS